MKVIIHPKAANVTTEKRGKRVVLRRKDGVLVLLVCAVFLGSCILWLTMGALGALGLLLELAGAALAITAEGDSAYFRGQFSRFKPSARARLWPVFSETDGGGLWRHCLCPERSWPGNGDYHNAAAASGGFCRGCFAGMMRSILFCG